MIALANFAHSPDWACIRVDGDTQGGELILVAAGETISPPPEIAASLVVLGLATD